jgi:hypothetical protein
LKDLEIDDCFRFFDGTSFEDAKKKAAQSFFYVTAPNGPKPTEDKVPCLTFDKKLYRLLDADRLVIKHDLSVAIRPAFMVNIPAVQALEDASESA